MIKNLLKSNLTLIIFTIFVIALILYFANQQSWKYHLSTDIYGFYFPRADYFLTNLRFGGFSENEYFPGAMFFFILPSLGLIFGTYGWEQYLAGLFFINIYLTILILIIYKRYSFISPYIFLVFLLASGPILFYRHELFVSFIIILSILLYKKKLIYRSVFLLGVATSIKIFPLLVFPYYLQVSFKNKTPKIRILKEISYFLLGILSVVLIYLLFGKLSDIISALTLNSIKPVHAESIWGSILPLISKLTSGTWAIGKGEHGIFGIDPAFIVFPLYFYNYFFIIPLSILYAYFYKKSSGFRVEAVLLIILLFEIFSKILTPQYLFWFILLFPLILNRNSKFLIASSSIIIFLVLFLTQYLYPIHYNELLSGFFLGGERIDLYMVLLLRNTLLILLFTQLLIHYAKK